MRANALVDIARNLSQQRQRLDILDALEFPLDLTLPFLNLPGLRGLWAAGGTGSGGGMFDRSGAGLTLTYNGNPTQNIDNGYTPYWDYDGTGDFHSRADEAAFDILGTEAFMAAAVRGLTMGLWVYSTVAGANQGLVSKWTTTGNQRSYRLVKTSADLADFSVSGSGTNEFAVTSAATLSPNEWHFLVGRYTPSTELALWMDGVKAVNTTAIPAAIFNSTTAFEIARYNGATLLTGRVALAFLCGAALSDNLCQALWYRSRAVFWV